MTDYLILRFDAPMMSFGGVLVDRHGPTRDFPGASMLVGLIGNALGFERREFERLDRLQTRVRYAVRCDREGERFVDYHTVDLGQDFMLEGWTRRGIPESRAGGGAGEGTHIRLRHYLAGAVYTVALTLDPADETPTLDEVASALASPERPLFLGRKCCLPATPILAGRIEAASPYDAVRRAEPTDDQKRLWWAATDGGPDAGELLYVSDTRDWSNDVPVGRRAIRHHRLETQEDRHGER